MDGHNFPNLCLMKIAAFHRAKGDSVEWWQDSLTRYDVVYKSKVFTDTADHNEFIYANRVVSGGTGYGLDNKLPDAVEHTCPDYSLYPGYPEAYGFLTRGCPNNCEFCIVTRKEGRVSKQVADLGEFHRDQREIKLLDPNLLACRDREKLLDQLASGGAWVDFTQGLDARLLDRDNIRLLQRVKKKMVHFAWDRERDSEAVLSGLRLYKELTRCGKRNTSVYVLVNYDTSFDFDLHRVYTLRRMGFHPYVMLYGKGGFVHKNRLRDRDTLRRRFTEEQIAHFLLCWRLQGWVNNRRIWESCERFEDYNRKTGRAGS